MANFDNFNSSDESQNDQPAARWAARVNRDQAQGLICLRGAVGVELLETQEHLWLKGDNDTDKIDGESSLETLRRVLGANRFYRTDDDQLIPVGKRIPVMALPEGQWQPLDQALKLVMPIASLAGRLKQLPASSPLGLLRQPNRFTDLTREPDLLICNLDHWCEFAATTAEIRLKQLRFVCDDNRTVMVSGNPLPEIPGRRFVSYDQVAVEIGWSWFPAISPEALIDSFRVGPGRTVIWMDSDCWTSVSDDQWITANRNSIRKTASINNLTHQGR